MRNSSADLSLADQFRALPADVRAERLGVLTSDEAAALRYNWEWWRRPSQQLPEGDWITWLILAGRGWGKTRCGAETVRVWARDNRFVNLIGATADDARDIMIDGESGILAICPKRDKPIYHKASRKLVWPSGCTSLIFTADEPERLRGKQSEKLWCLVGDTKVTMGDGTYKMIKDIRADEFVLTRKGPRRVLAVSSHIDKVGTVSFSNGSKITGTGKHPMIQCNGEMTCLQNLSTGDCVPTDTSALILAQSMRAESAREFISTGSIGNKPMGGCPRAMSSTIEMGTRQIIGSPTLSARAKQATHESIPQAIPTAQASHSQNRMCNAPTVDVFLFGDQGSKSNCVSPASINGQNLNGRPQNPAIIVESNSSRGLEITAASVVSTWEAVGSAEVFDLGIEGEPEFFANGLLSHNCDEVAAWRYREAWDQAMLGLRLGDKPQCVVTTTPRPTDLIKRLATAKTTHLTTGSTYDNKANLAGAFLEQIVTRYEGTRLGRQELNAEILDDNPGALWKRDWIDRSRLSLAPDMARIVVGVDPAVTSNDDSDLTGVVVAGMDRQNPPHYYVLADYSRIATPDSWAQSVINAYHQHGADRIVAEVNNGGDLVGTIIRQKDANCAYTAVRATRGKQLRAEPIASLYEQDRVHHVGSIPELEDQMLGWDPISSDKSPDRLDALVWALTELSTPVPGAGFLAWMEQQAKR